MRISPTKCLLVMGVLLAVTGGAMAQVTTPALAPSQSQSQAQAIMDYWTPERMAAAQPMPQPTMIVKAGAAPMAAPMALGEPGVMDGNPPGGGPWVPNARTLSRAEAQALAAPIAPMDYGVAPTNPLVGPWGPFQRWAMEGNYLPYPRSIHGKLFFNIGTSGFVCSATVINRSTIATAGHCVAAGDGATWYNSWLFCPSYYNGGAGGTGIPYPTRGCWAWDQAATSGPWFNTQDADYDYACIVTSVTGTVVANKVGNVTGWPGRAWNFGAVNEVAFGYPQAAPFDGAVIHQAVGPDWYSWDSTAGGLVSKIMGSDLTGGSSGGGWFLSWSHPSVNPANLVSNPSDPSFPGPYINGVNSHKRCLVDCRTPPIATAGVFWGEMSSPPFTNATQGSESVFTTCGSNTNNN